ncbi:MAG: hypothetical protein MR425_08660 [Lachnospiraceae bacterium]|nr:hypothetical protein [Lachnospiraceae bacterium]
MNQKKRDEILPEIECLMKENGGIVKASQLYPLGLTFRMVQGLVQKGVLDHVKSGYYSMNYEQKSEEAIICGMFPDGILTMDSALYYYGYINERPFTWSIAVSKNTSKSRFKIEYPVIRPYYTEPEVLESGASRIQTESGTMKIYGKERLICDCLKYEDRLDKDVLKRALLSYIQEEKKDIAALMEYARARKVLTKVQNRIGVWL